MSVRLQVIAPIPNTQSHLLRIVSTLEKDYMKSAPPSSILDLEQYAEGTSSQLLYLQVKCSPCTAGSLLALRVRRTPVMVPCPSSPQHPSASNILHSTWHQCDYLRCGDAQYLCCVCKSRTQIDRDSSRVC